ncbi:hypothetical protein JHK84_044356 [Glycine max]|nr:hypothetical protein JHK86_044248 [Glycine max]KAG5107449.1 hypothetical protein JHK84_044356 [Glycine max]
MPLFPLPPNSNNGILESPPSSELSPPLEEFLTMPSDSDSGDFYEFNSANSPPPFSASTYNIRAFLCINFSMFKKPLFLEGVKLCCNPNSVTKSGVTRMISLTGRPERPWTSSAARPLVRPESESAS